MAELNPPKTSPSLPLDRILEFFTHDRVRPLRDMSHSPLAFGQNPVNQSSQNLYYIQEIKVLIKPH